jgi:hypothetical protein
VRSCCSTCRRGWGNAALWHIAWLVLVLVLLLLLLLVVVVLVLAMLY